MFNLWIVLLSLSVQAKVLQGVVYLNRSGEYSIDINDDTESRLPLYSATSSVATDVRKLNSGDVLTGKGIKNQTGAFLDSVDFVQLNNIVGTWENKSDNVTFHIQTPAYAFLTTGKGSKKQTLPYVFALAPGEKTKWTIFMYPSPSDEDSQIIPGSVTFNNPTNSKVLRLVLYNPDTGRIQLQSTLLRKSTKVTPWTRNNLSPNFLINPLPRSKNFTYSLN